MTITLTNEPTITRPAMTRMSDHEVRLTERFHILLDVAGMSPIDAATVIWRRADLDLPFTGAFMEHLTGGAVTVDAHDRLQRGPRWDNPGTPGRPLPTAVERNVALLVDLTEQYGLPAPIGEFASCDCSSDIAQSGTCCERGRRRQGIPVPPMPYGVGMYVPTNRD